jgi:flavorubredoxin
MWTGGCVDLNYQGENVHSHFSVYLVRGSEKSLLIDTGHPAHWAQIEHDVEEFLQGRPLDYAFVTHGEFPHAGLLANWLRKYPQAIGIGEVRDYDLYYPDLADRLRFTRPSEHVDLGDREVVFVPAVWRDIPTQWAFDTLDRVLFVSDAFAYLHFHQTGQCDLKTSEQPLPNVNMTRFFNERALVWTRYADVTQTFSEIDALLGDLNPNLIAGAHGGIVDTKEAMISLVKEGMTVGWS